MKGFSKKKEKRRCNLFVEHVLTLKGILIYIRCKQILFDSTYRRYLEQTNSESESTSVDARVEGLGEVPDLTLLTRELVLWEHSFSLGK